MNAKVAAVGIFLIVGTVGTRMIVFIKEADRQLTKDAGGEAYYSAELTPETVEEAIPEDLPGMPASLQPALDLVLKKDAAALKAWIQQYRPYLKDPKLSEIELEYVKKVGRKDPAQARKTFAEIDRRNGPDSPLRPRIDQLANTYR
jgi:hypothetical protein